MSYKTLLPLSSTTFCLPSEYQSLAFVKGRTRNLPNFSLGRDKVDDILLCIS